MNQDFFPNDSVTYITEQTRGIDRSGLSNNIRFGSDFFLGKKSTLTTSFTYRISNQENLSTIEYKDFLNSKDNPTLRTERTDEETEDERNIMLALNYEKNFDRKGQKFTADFQYQTSGEVEFSDFTEKYFLPDGTAAGITDLKQRGNIDESNTEFLLKTDYIHPFGEHGKFETGYRGSLRQIRNDYSIAQFNDTEWQTIPQFSNDFIYDENIHGLYALFGNKVKKFQYHLGLRGEYTDIKTELVETNQTNPRDYFNLFPTATFTYDLPAKNAVQISYSRRITRPRFWFLNPLLSFSDARNPFVGNPDLDPELTHSLELSHIKYFAKGTLTSSIYYRHTTGKIQRIREVFNQQSARTIPVNLSIEDTFGVELTYTYTVAKWWRLNGDFNFFRSIVEGEYEMQNFGRDDYSWRTRFTSKLTLWKKLDSQIRLNYRGPIESVQGLTLAIYFLDLGFSMDVLKGKGTITLNARDLFNTRKRRGFSYGANFESYGEFQWRSRQINLNFNYRLNQKKKRGGPRGGGNFGGGEGF